MNLHHWKKDYWLWLPLMLITWRLAWHYQDTFISDWDTFDYTAQVVQGVPTALGLGRALFLGYNRGLWLLAHHWFSLPPEKAYLILRYSVIALSAPAIVGIYALYKELTKSRIVACAGALLFVNSPYFIIYSGRGMSEIPGLLTFAWGAWWMFRNLRLGKMWQSIIGAGLFGLSANMREFSVFYFPVIALAGLVKWATAESLVLRFSALSIIESWLVRFGLTLKNFRWVVGASVVGLLATFAGPIFWALYWPEYYLPALRGWYSLSAQERQLHPVDFSRNWEHLISFGYECSCIAISLAPLALAWIGVRLWRDKENRASLWPLLWLGVFGWLSVLAMLENHDLPVNPRYLLLALPGVALTCGWFLADLIKRHYFLTAAGLIYLSYFAMGEQWPKIEEKMRWQREANEAASQYLSRIDNLNRDAVFIVGSRTPLVNFYRSIGARPNWKTIAAGSGWPDEQLDDLIDQHLSEGRAVYVDFDENLWKNGERGENREAPGLTLIQRTYQVETLHGKLCRVLKKIS